METEPGTSGRKRKKRKRIFRILAIFFLLFSLAGYYLYNNYNRLLSDALMRSFNSNIVSDVYELKFEKLRVNLFQGDISVFNVVMKPREKPLNSYPYINSSFGLTTQKILLKNVQILALLKQDKLELEKIEIIKPEIELTLEGKINVLFPVKDTSDVQEQKSKKKFVEAFLLKEFQLVDASFRVSNSYKERQFRIGRFNIALNEIKISQEIGRDLFSYNQVDLSIGEFAGTMQKGPLRHLNFRDYHIKIDSLRINKTLDTLIFGFDDFQTSIKSLDIQTADSIFHVQMESMNISYKDESIKMTGIGFKPNMSYAALQKRYRYQHTDFSASIANLDMVKLNFDSLIYCKKLFIDKIILDSVSASIFKDNTKPVDIARVPVYFGQQVMSIPIPILIKQVEVRNINLVNTERKRDSSYAKVNINRGVVLVNNITNITAKELLTLNADAYIENKVLFNVRLGFNYLKPQFTLDGTLGKFNLPDLNPVIQAYTPAKINKGVADQIKFSGTVYRTNATGEMKFLYHDLDIDLQIQNKAKWKSSLGSFAANAYLPSGNPASKEMPPRIVQYKAERNMNKGFINIIIKSVLSGLKETMFMSKENRKAYKDEKKKMKQKNKK